MKCFNNCKTDMSNELSSKHASKIVKFAKKTKFTSKEDTIQSNQFCYNTITSQKSLFSIDSNNLVTFPNGEIEFNDGLQRFKRSHYVRVSVNSDIEDVVRYLAVRWLRRSPKIIIPIVTSLSHFKSWKNQRQLNKFKRGLIKAAYTTDLWYITNGYNIGVSKLIGDAVREESLARRTNDTSSQATPDPFDRLTLIGIVSTSDLRNKELFQGQEEIVNYNFDENDQNSDLFDLNPDHTHFILVDDDGIHSKLLEFRVALEKRLQKPIFQRKTKRSLNGETNSNINHTSTNTTSTSTTIDDTNQYDTIPIVCLVIGGGIGSISIVLTKLNQGIPVLVFKGSGNAPDLISGTYEDFADRFENISQNHLRSAIAIRITEKFPKEAKNDSIRNKIKENILEILKCASSLENGNLLTFLDAFSINADLHDLDKYILVALIQSQPSQSKELLKKNLMLIMDWNRPDIALSEIFHRDSSSKLDVEKFMFERALLKKNREEFIEIFLDQGFQIHRFLNHIKMFLLFEKCEDREFFLSVCMEKGLGVKLTHDDFDEMRNHPPTLFQKYINPLVHKLSDIDEFFQVLEMSLNALKLYVESGEFVAERKALMYLIVFAVLLKRHKLAKILWKRTDQPICVALLCSMIYKRAAFLVHESYLKSELEEYSKDFARCAVGVLDLSFAQSDSRVYDVLNRKNPDLNDLTAIELAYNSDNKDFIAHPCCQKWLTKKFYGGLDMRELNFGFVKVPTWLKILLSACLIFPMYFWVVFPSKQKKTTGLSNSENSFELDVDPDDEDDMDEEKMIRTELMNISTNNSNRKKVFKYELKYQDGSSLPLRKRVMMLWSAPITKFWINLIFYIIYLCLFGLAVLWPSCGNIILDSVVWFWTALICCETTRRTYNKYVMGSNLPLKLSCIEIIIMLIFLTLYLFLRILNTNNSDVLTSKSILCCGLIYFYYRSVFVYLPISPTLGPMLVKMKYMVQIDFLTFLRMFIVFMAAGGITINAIVYPYYPLNSELIKRVFLRAFFGLFVTEKDDLNGRECKYKIDESKGACSSIHDRLPLYGNRTETWKEQGVSYDCPYPSLIGWAILIQYLLLVKLFLTTLLTAMFSHTKAKVDAESDQIWMFQRYEIVIDYEQRLRLPPPLTIISYMILLFQWIFKQIKTSSKKILYTPQKNQKDFSTPKGFESLFRSDANKISSLSSAKPSNCPHQSVNKKQYDHSNYWRNVVQDFAKKIDDSAKEKDVHREQAVGLFKLREDSYVQKKNLKRLDDRMVSIERNLTAIQVAVEYIQHFITNKESLSLQSVNVGKHVMARQSPYPFTQLSRFPVFDKYVSWEIFYDLYDPPSIYVDKSLTFNPNEIQFTDPDDLNLIEMSSSGFAIFENDAELSKCENINELFVKKSDNNDQMSANSHWNKLTMCLVHDQKVVIDRATWISKDGFAGKYDIDVVGYPINPMGRTGVRGRGALFRWGPNHEIRVIVSRWRKYAERKYMHVDGRRMLEFLACKDPLYGEWKLPGGKILGHISPYAIVCSSFAQLIFEQIDTELKDIESEEQMKSFFRAYASETSALTARMIYKGYIDDPRNTDNAWVEAEIWNFHYGDQDKLNESIPNYSSKWKEVSSHARLFANQNAILKEIANIHEAYY